MPETTKNTETPTRDATKDTSVSGGLWKAVRKLFGKDGGSSSLRAQLEELIDDHEGQENERQSEGKPLPDNGDLSASERTMLRNLLHFSEHDADDVAIPRGEIIAIASNAKWDDMVSLFIEHGVSRLPVFREQLDDVIGMMHVKDVFAFIARGKTPPIDWTDLMRQPLFVPQTRNALDVLADMRSKRVHLAIVVDEFSGTDGIITFEDLVEEIVGEIEDEHDEDPVEQVVRISDGIWQADARAELDDVAKILGDPRIAEVAESVDTLGGLAFVLAEKVPQTGQVLTHPSGWRIEVTQSNETHVKQLRLHRPTDDALDSDTE